jgi:hypothetical protein
VIESVTIRDNPVTATPNIPFGVLNFHPAGTPARFLPRTYKRTLGDLGGYLECDFHLVGEAQLLNRMLAESLAREVQASNYLGLEDFLGVVWSMKYVTRDYWVRYSLENVYNRILVIFTRQDDDEEAERDTSATWNDTNSQERYGILTWQHDTDKPVHSADEIDLPAEASKDELSRPGRQKSVGDRGDSKLRPFQARLEVHARGYHEYLKRRYYLKTDVDEDAQEDIAVVIQAVSDSVGQFVASTDIAANTSHVDQYYEGDLTAWEILTQDIFLTDATPDRYVLGMWEGRQLKYEARVDMGDPEQVAYFKLQDGRYRNRDGRIIHPSEIRPNNLIKYSAIMPQRPGRINANRRDPLQNAYIRQVIYDGGTEQITIQSAPYSDSAIRWQKAILGDRQYARKKFT